MTKLLSTFRFPAKHGVFNGRKLFNKRNSCFYLCFESWGDGREAEGAGLLNLYTRKGIEGSNPSLSAQMKCSGTCIHCEISAGAVMAVAVAPLAQLDRASDYESEGQRFESSRERGQKAEHG